MQRYDCLTAVGADHIEATLRLAPSLDRPAPATGHTIGEALESSGESEDADHRATVSRLLSRHLPEPITVHDLTAPPASSTIVAPTSLALYPTAGPRRQG